MIVDRTAVLLSIQPKYVDRILARTKLWEFRRKPLPEGVETVLVWRTGRAGGLVARFDVLTQATLPARHFASQLAARPNGAFGIYSADLIAYAGHNPDLTLTAIRISDLAPFEQVVPAKKLDPELHRAPQSWRYAPDGWRTALHDALQAADAPRDGIYAATRYTARAAS